MILLCLLAAGANFLLNTVCVYFFKLPLFLDTVFTAAVCFAAGLFPGIAVGVLSWVAVGIRNGGLDPFVLCTIAEVLIIYRLKPVYGAVPSIETGRSQATTITSFVSVFARLMVLYIVCSMAMSILGGAIDYVYHRILENPKIYFSAEEVFKIGLLRSGIHALAVDILSRIPVNIVDRFIVIFGGYFVSRALVRVI